MVNPYTVNGITITTNNNNSSSVDQNISITTRNNNSIFNTSGTFSIGTTIGFDNIVNLLEKYIDENDDYNKLEFLFDFFNKLIEDTPIIDIDGERINKLENKLKLKIIIYEDKK